MLCLVGKREQRWERLGSRSDQSRPQKRGYLKAKLADKRLPAKIHERYRIIGALCERATAEAASRMVGCSEGKAEHWVHRFNASGFTTFEKQPNHRGRPLIIDGPQVRALIRVALSRPQDLGPPCLLPLSTRLYLVMDNLNTHKHERLRAFMAAHNIEPVSTPTYASWLNAIESHFAPLKKFAIAGTDDPSHEYHRWRIARYLTWRNRCKGSHRAALAKFSRVKLYQH